MRVKGISELDLALIVGHVSRVFYAGNLIFKREPETIGRFVHFTLRVKDSKGPGARRSHSGRRLVSACWHAHRDVMVELFDFAPDALLVTAMARYEGREGFLREYPGTGSVNLGSAFEPMAYRDACDCDPAIRARAVWE